MTHLGLFCNEDNISGVWIYGPAICVCLSYVILRDCLLTLFLVGDFSVRPVVASDRFFVLAERAGCFALPFDGRLRRVAESYAEGLFFGHRIDFILADLHYPLEENRVPLADLDPHDS